MRRSTLALYLLTGSLALAAPPAPDYVVSHIEFRAPNLYIEVQNQGPGRGSGTLQGEFTLRPDGSTREPVPFRLSLPAPIEEFGVATFPPIDIRKWGLKPEKFGFFLHGKINPDRSLPEALWTNNEFDHPLYIGWATGKLIERAHPDLRTQAGVPDLVCQDILYRGGRLYCVIANQGKGATGADYVVRFKTNNQYRDTNAYYRDYQPPPGQHYEKGGLALNLFGLQVGQRVPVTCEVDPEHRVREENKANNLLTKTLSLGPDLRSLPLPGKNSSGSLQVGASKVPIVTSLATYCSHPNETILTLYLLSFQPTSSEMSAILSGQISQALIHRGQPRPGWGSLELTFYDSARTTDMKHLAKIVYYAEDKVALTEILRQPDGFQMPAIDWTRGVPFPFQINTTRSMSGQTFQFHVQGKAPIYPLTTD